MMYKKGLSPLISSILLISISITVVAMISIMSDDIVVESSDRIDTSRKNIQCQDVYVDIKQYNNKDMVCLDGDELNIFIQNIGYDTYHGININLVHKNFSIDTLEKYSQTEFYSAENKLLKYNISNYDISNLNEIEIKIGLRDNRKATYFCALAFTIPSYRLINCASLYN